MVKKKRSQNAIESPEYVEQWAQDIITFAGKREARRLLEGYKGIASDKRVAKYDRDVAAQRARILKKYL